MSRHPTIDIDTEVLAAFLAESLDVLGELDEQFIRLEDGSTPVETMATIFRAAHSIKGNAPFFGLMKIKVLAHELESVLAAVRDGRARVNNTLISLLLKGFDELKQMMRRVQCGGPEVSNENEYNQLLCHVRQGLKHDELPATGGLSPGQGKEIRAILETFSSIELSDGARILVGELEHILYPLCQPSVREEVTDKHPSHDPDTVSLKSQNHSGNTVDRRDSNRPSLPEPRQVADVHKTMRVPEEKIDAFLEFVGELIVVREMFDCFGENLADNNTSTLLREFTTAYREFSRLSLALERAIMTIRKIPVRLVLQKIPRIVRDVALATGKSIDVKISGEVVEIDKSLVELLDAPLTHMVRNAADHGIELPDIRRERGKPERGTIEVRCDESERYVEIQVIDDGGGINRTALRQKAISLGLLDASTPLSDSTMIDLLFRSGVSTAEQVSDISGRGVGMDVVKQAIEGAGGSIKVETSTGAGSKFTILLPRGVTTQIIDGLVTKVGTSSIVFPLELVEEVWMVDDNAVGKLPSEENYCYKHDEPLILRSLRDILQIAGLGDPVFAVSVRLGGKNTAFLVDHIVGKKQLVVKQLPQLFSGGGIFRGAAVLGDGDVALVIEPELLRHTSESSSKNNLHNDYRVASQRCNRT